MFREVTCSNPYTTHEIFNWKWCSLNTTRAWVWYGKYISNPKPMHSHCVCFGFEIYSPESYPQRGQRWTSWHSLHSKIVSLQRIMIMDPIYITHPWETCGVPLIIFNDSWRRSVVLCMVADGMDILSHSKCKTSLRCTVMLIQSFKHGISQMGPIPTNCNL